MGGGGANKLEDAVFAHQLRAMLARQAQEDREAIGAHLRRAGFQVQDLEDRKMTKRRANGPSVDFFAASPLTGRDRQSGGFRIPHVDFKPITPTIGPTSKGGARRAHKVTHMTAVQHIDYVTDGAKVEFASHFDYIARVTGAADPFGELKCDALDELADRNEKNALSFYTNIPGGKARARSLFQAAEEAVPAPKTYELLVSTAEWETFADRARLAGTPAWLLRMEQRLRAERGAIVERAASEGKATRHRRQVVVDRLSSADAFDRLELLDGYPDLKGKVDWKQGRTQRCQYRFVGELPEGLSTRDRHAILSDFCDQLGEDGWMVVGAIHQPDATNDKRNYHVHIDLYDRKAQWLEQEGCWDFAYSTRRDGKPTHPYRQNKVRYEKRGADGKLRKFNVAGLMRSRFIEAVNAVGEKRGVVSYLHGTYKDNNIDLTPLEHMGNRAMGHERRGIVTEVGSRNARQIAADEAAACEKRAAAAEAALADEMTHVRRRAADIQQALRAAERYELLQRRLIRRRLQADLVDIVIAMARSRADAVVRSLTPAPGHRIRLNPGDAELLAEAQQHLGWVRRTGPSPRDWEVERQLVAKAEHRAVVSRTTFQEAASRATAAQNPVVITYCRRRDVIGHAAKAHPLYETKMRGRLSEWLDKHSTDPNKLAFVGNEARLGKAVPPSIDTLMARFASEQQFQLRLLTEQRRREASAAAQHRATQVKTPAAGVAPPVGMTSWSQSQLPQEAPEIVAQVSTRVAADGADRKPATVQSRVSTDEQAAWARKQAKPSVVSDPASAGAASLDADRPPAVGPAKAPRGDKGLDLHPTVPKPKGPSMWEGVGRLARAVGSKLRNRSSQYGDVVQPSPDERRAPELQTPEPQPTLRQVPEAPAYIAARKEAASTVISSSPPASNGLQPLKAHERDNHARAPARPSRSISISRQPTGRADALKVSDLQGPRPSGVGALLTEAAALPPQGPEARVWSRAPAARQVTGLSADRETDKPHPAKAPGPEGVPDQPTPARKGGVFAHAEAMRGDTVHPEIRSKGGPRGSAVDDDRPWPSPGRNGQER